MHRDGWGVAFYRDGTAIIIKEPLPAPESSMAKILRDTGYVWGNIVISHVRLTTGSRRSYANTHPFKRELYGREWVFAHNGDVGKIMESDEYKLTYYNPVGETDSEYAFCYIMDRLREAGRNSLSNPYLVRNVLENTANKIQEFGKFNFLLSDGKYLYAYMSRTGQLHYVFRHPPHTRTVELMDEDFEVDLGEIKSPDEKATLIATRPLTRGEKWHEFPLRKVLIFSDGEPLSIEALDEKEKNVLAFIRSQPHRVSIRQIANTLGILTDEAAQTVNQLRIKGWIKQDGRDTVPPNHPNATFYTKNERRSEIDKKLKNLIRQF